MRGKPFLKKGVFPAPLSKSFPKKEQKIFINESIMKEYRLVIAGCRSYNNYFRLSREVKKYIKTLGKDYLIIIVSGCASGADALGERFAQKHKLQIERYPAQWEKYGKFAGPRRNSQMAKVADGVIVFWDGESRGTKSMIECKARK